MKKLFIIFALCFAAVPAAADNTADLVAEIEKTIDEIIKKIDEKPRQKIMDLAADCQKLPKTMEEIKKGCGGIDTNPGHTLSWAAACNNAPASAVGSILKCDGVNVDWENDDGMSALDYACIGKDKDKINLIEEAIRKKHEHDFKFVSVFFPDNKGECTKQNDRIIKDNAKFRKLCVKKKGTMDAADACRVGKDINTMDQLKKMCADIEKDMKEHTVKPEERTGGKYCIKQQKK